jgi:hypothetical protein
MVSVPMAHPKREKARRSSEHFGPRDWLQHRTPVTTPNDDPPVIALVLWNVL